MLKQEVNIIFFLFTTFAPPTCDVTWGKTWKKDTKAGGHKKQLKLFTVYEALEVDYHNDEVTPRAFWCPSNVAVVLLELQLKGCVLGVNVVRGHVLECALWNAKIIPTIETFILLSSTVVFFCWVVTRVWYYIKITPLKLIINVKEGNGGSVAQWLGRLPWDPEIPGSRPALNTRWICSW